MANDGIFGNTGEDEGTSADDTKDEYRAPALAKLLVADIASTAGFVKLVFIQRLFWLWLSGPKGNKQVKTKNFESDRKCQKFGCDDKKVVRPTNE